MWRKVLDAEMSDPERRSANFGILIGVSVFAGGVAFLRFAGDLLVPTF